jgi:hypothetical protein
MFVGQRVGVSPMGPATSAAAWLIGSIDLQPSGGRLSCGGLLGGYFPWRVSV